MATHHIAPTRDHEGTSVLIVNVNDSSHRYCRAEPNPERGYFIAWFDAILQLRFSVATGRGVGAAKQWAIVPLKESPEQCAARWRHTETTPRLRKTKATADDAQQAFLIASHMGNRRAQ